MPCDPVDINLVKGYIDTYTTWSAAIEENTITIDINNDQVVLLYSDQGILIREEVISAGQVVSTLSISIPSEPSISFGGLFPLFFITALIGAIFIKWNTRNR